MRVAIIGTGYVGLTTGVCLAAIGHEVVCVDSDPSKIDTLRGGHCPIYEPHLEQLMAQAAPRLRFAASCEQAVPSADVVFIAVGTPTGPGGAPDLQYLRAAAQSIGETLSESFTVVVNKSTVPIGSGNWVDSLIRQTVDARFGRGATARFAVASNPEFLREGSAIHDSLYPDRIVVGADHPRAVEVLFNLYRPILEQSFTAPPYVPRPEGLDAVPLVTADLASAELIKYAANAFLALKISFVNEIGRLAGRVGAETATVAKGIGLDRRIGGAFLNAGVGWGGSCFAKDTLALVSTAGEYGLDMPIVAAAREINRRQREFVVDRLLDELKILKGRTVAIFGLAFKPNTDDLRDAPAVDIAKSLLSRGAQVKAHDPVAMDRARHELASLDWSLESSAEAAADQADAIVLVTEWSVYRQLDWTTIAPRLRRPLVLDCRNCLDRAQLEAAGLRIVRLVG